MYMNMNGIWMGEQYICTCISILQNGRGVYFGFMCGPFLFNLTSLEPLIPSHSNYHKSCKPYRISPYQILGQLGNTFLLFKTFILFHVQVDNPITQNLSVFDSQDFFWWFRETADWLIRCQAEILSLRWPFHLCHGATHLEKLFLFSPTLMALIL